ncbi:hypothetical protein LguiB_011032 [Lonicera macranthoides]
MSSSPSKSQSRGPLHNFLLPELKWSSSHHWGRISSESSSKQSVSPSPNAAIVHPPPPPIDAAKTAQMLVPVNGDKAFSSSNSDRMVKKVFAVKVVGEKPQSSNQIFLLMKAKPIEVPPEEEEVQETRSRSSKTTGILLFDIV